MFFKTPKNNEGVPVRSKYFWREILDTVVDIALVVGLALLIKTYLFAPFQVHGQSMCNTLNVDPEGKCRNDNYEYIVVSKISYLLGTPERGDIVVLEPPNNTDSYYIKRVIGVPGDRVKIDSNAIYIFSTEKGRYVQLDEPYLKCKTEVNGQTVNDCHNPPAAQKEYVVPEGKYLVMGDNRNNSTDSRSCFGDGCTLPQSTPYVTKAEIVGKTIMVWWPVTNWRLVSSARYVGI